MGGKNNAGGANTEGSSVKESETDNGKAGPEAEVTAQEEISRDASEASPEGAATIDATPDASASATARSQNDAAVQFISQPPAVPGYEIIKPIGKGGSGVVYLARQVSMDRVVALKILAKKLITDAQWVDRFIKTARYTGRLNHPNMVIAHDCGRHEDTCYLAMEYVDGTSLSRILKKETRLSEQRTLEIIRQIAEALDHAHKAGLVHRDIKPGNILLSKDGWAKLTDLGLAKFVGAPGTDEDQGDTETTGRFTAVGTPKYIAPEQAMAKEDIDVRADIYSLGITMFHMLVGEAPFYGTPAEVLTDHIRTPCPTVKEFVPEISERTNAIVARMVEKNPDARYQTPAELVIDLKQAEKEMDHASDRTIPAGLPGEPMDDNVPVNLLFDDAGPAPVRLPPKPDASPEDLLGGVGESDIDEDHSDSPGDISPGPETPSPGSVTPVEKFEKDAAKPDKPEQEHRIPAHSSGLADRLKKAKMRPNLRPQTTSSGADTVSALRGRDEPRPDPVTTRETRTTLYSAVPQSPPKPTEPSGAKIVYALSHAARQLIQNPPNGALRLIPDGIKGDEIVLSAGIEIIFGREKVGCDVLLIDKRTSRRHCSVTQKERTVIVTDFGSSNGTFHNEKRVAGKAILKSGDRLRIGSTNFRIQG
ncbi:MAG TPA: FHA domain-containing serine/threonine-protein kinase [Candidatus Brocadiia bacterium]|nr:FHA domain-containing serine/threonine-protein kinase [Candidatus Brocadiia bacterium]